MSTPQPPYGPPAHQVPPAAAPTAPLPQQAGYPQQGGYPQPGGPVPPAGGPAAQVAPTPQKPRPGKTLPVLALVSAIIGTFVVCLGFLSFIPEAGRGIGFLSFIGWAFLIAGLVMSIVALAKKAAALGISIAALAVSLAGSVLGIAAAIVVAVAGIFTYTTTIIDEFGDLVPTDPEDGWTLPEGSADPDVQADCDALLAAGPGAASGPSDLGALFDSLADQMSTDEVSEPLDDLADAYEDLAEARSADDASAAQSAAQRAATQLGAACGFELDDLP